MNKIMGGVYFLYKGDELVYIGQSSNIFYRIGQHINDNVKDFDKWMYIPFENEQERKKTESFLINCLKPVYNVTDKNNDVLDLNIGGDRREQCYKEMYRYIAMSEMVCWVDSKWIWDVFRINKADLKVMIDMAIIPERYVKFDDYYIWISRWWIMNNFVVIVEEANRLNGFSYFKDELFEHGMDYMYEQCRRIKESEEEREYKETLSGKKTLEKVRKALQ